jgi:hypothetical protein
MLGEARGRGLDQLAAHTAGKAHPFAVHVGAGVLPDLERLRVLAELDADFLQHRLGVVLDERQPLLGEGLVERDLAGDELPLAKAAAGAHRAPRLAPAACSPPPAFGRAFDLTHILDPR